MDGSPEGRREDIPDSAAPLIDLAARWMREARLIGPLTGASHLIADDLPDASFLDVVTGGEQGNDGATGAPETTGNLTALEGASAAVEVPAVSGLRQAAGSS